VEAGSAALLGITAGSGTGQFALFPFTVFCDVTKPRRSLSIERCTVELSDDLHDKLARWATQRKRSVGRRVPKTEVVRVLIELLLADPSLATQVEDRLKEKYVPPNGGTGVRGYPFLLTYDFLFFSRY
jgi:hypothetical protein